MMKHQMWVDQKKVRARFRDYRSTIRDLRADLALESRSVDYYRRKAEDERRSIERLRRQASDDRDECERARWAAQSEFDKLKKEAVGYYRRA